MQGPHYIQATRPTIPEFSIDIDLKDFSDIIRSLLYQSQPDDPNIRTSFDALSNTYSRVVHSDDESLNPVSRSDSYVNAFRLLQGLLLIAKHLDAQLSTSNAIIAFIRTEYGVLKQDYEGYKALDAARSKVLINLSLKLLEQRLECNPAQALTQLLHARDTAILMERKVNVKTSIPPSDKRGNISTVKFTAPQAGLAEQYMSSHYEVRGSRAAGYSYRFRNEQEWFKSLASRSGLPATDSWQLNFYMNNRQALMGNYASAEAVLHSNSAVTTDRCTPLPAGYDQNTLTVTVGKAVMIERSASWYRLATIVPIKLPPEKGSDSTLSPFLQERENRLNAAVEILKGILYTKLRAKLLDFSTKYQELIDAFSQGESLPFYFSYCTLLSPLLYERLTKISDNNNFEMVEIAKRAMQECEKFFYDNDRNLDPGRAYNYTDVDQALFSLYQEFPKIMVRCTHINSPVNYCADEQSLLVRSRYFVASSFGGILLSYAEEDNVTIDEQLQWVSVLPGVKVGSTEDKAIFTSLLAFIRNEGDATGFNFHQSKHYLDQLEQEYMGQLCSSKPLQIALVKRLRASMAMRLLISDAEPKLYAGLSLDQKGIMKAALYVHMLDDQALLLLGCKSARERYGVVATAIATMLENEEAFFDWEIIRRNIPEHLRYGHDLANTASHVAGALKVAGVKSEYREACLPLSRACDANVSYLNLKDTAPPSRKTMHLLREKSDCYQKREILKGALAVLRQQKRAAWKAEIDSQVFASDNRSARSGVVGKDPEGRMTGFFPKKTQQTPGAASLPLLSEQGWVALIAALRTNFSISLEHARARLDLLKQGEASQDRLRVIKRELRVLYEKHCGLTLSIDPAGEFSEELEFFDARILEINNAIGAVAPDADLARLQQNMTKLDQDDLKFYNQTKALCQKAKGLLATVQKTNCLTVEQIKHAQHIIDQIRQLRDKPNRIAPVLLNFRGKLDAAAEDGFAPQGGRLFQFDPNRNEEAVQKQFDESVPRVRFQPL
jgi:hypothetical protein